jgi:hypothetical protein
MEIITKCMDCQFFSKANYKACQSSSAYQSLLVIRNLGNQHCGHLAQDTGRIQILIYRYRHIHEVDGSYANSEHHSRHNGQILAEYHL